MARGLQCLRMLRTSLDESGVNLCGSEWLAMGGNDPELSAAGLEQVACSLVVAFLQIRMRQCGQLSDVTRLLTARQTQLVGWAMRLCSGPSLHSLMSRSGVGSPCQSTTTLGDGQVSSTEGSPPPLKRPRRGSPAAPPSRRRGKRGKGGSRRRGEGDPEQVTEGAGAETKALSLSPLQHMLLECFRLGPLLPSRLGRHLLVLRR